MVYIYGIFIMMIVFFLLLFLPGGVKRTLREKFYGNYYAECGVIAEDDVPNSEEAISKCAENGVGMKLPVFISADLKIFVSEFDDLSKQYGTDIKITTSTAREIENAGVLSLEKAIEIVGGRVPLLLDLKPGGDSAKLCRKTADAIFASKYDNIGVVSMYTGMLAWFKHTEKTIYRGMITAPAADFRNMKKLDAFIQGNALNQSACRPQLLIYRNKPVDKLAKVTYKIGMPKGVFLIENAREAKALESENEVIIIRGFMPENPHYEDLPDMGMAQIEIDREEKRLRKEELKQKRAEMNRRAEEEKEKKRAEKGKAPSKADKKAAYLYDDEEFGPRDTEYSETEENK